jgi:cyclopropane fatty-acyl-phospholipid synthase-like methyltransferase
MLSFEPEFYTSDFAKENMMGPNALRIVDELVRDCHFAPGSRILDLGCGKGLTSIFLARKYDVTVFATDLWIPATENYQRFQTFALEHKIIPIHADAHRLPFADNYFDGVISVDAYHYFGCDPEYLSRYLQPLVKKSGQIMIGVPGLQHEFTDGIPPELLPYWEKDMNFHSCAWWRALWSNDPTIQIESCQELECMQAAWADWLTCQNKHAEQDRLFLKAEGGKYFNLVGLKAIKN